MEYISKNFGFSRSLKFQYSWTKTREERVKTRGYESGKEVKQARVKLWTIKKDPNFWKLNDESTGKMLVFPPLRLGEYALRKTLVGKYTT